jgi:hypothetical protein
MKYNYKVIELTAYDQPMKSADLNKLQELFDDGWEYVDSITQPITTGCYIWKSAVGVVIRKEKQMDPLN